MDFTPYINSWPDFNAFQVTSKRQAELTVLRITNFPDLLVLVSLCAAFLMAYCYDINQNWGSS